MREKAERPRKRLSSLHLLGVILLDMISLFNAWY